MKLSWATALLLLCSTGVTAFPADLPSDPTDLIDADTVSDDFEYVDLEKRRGGGGGGGGGRGGGGGSSGGGSGGRSSGSSGGGGRGGGGNTGSTGSSGSRGGGTAASPSYGGGRYGSSTGGWGSWYGWGSGSTSRRPSSYTPSRPATHPVIDSARTYGGSRYYAGGASTAYGAGRRSPAGITPFLLPAAALTFFPAVWLYGAYAYPYSHHYNYYNENTHKNDSLPVVCVCQEYNPCGCDDNDNNTYYESLFNGTQPANTSDTRVVNVNGTEKIYINGTLPNGTDSENTSSSAASALGPTLLHASGYWSTLAVVGFMVWGL